MSDPYQTFRITPNEPTLTKQVILFGAYLLFEAWILATGGTISLIDISIVIGWTTNLLLKVLFPAIPLTDRLRVFFLLLMLAFGHSFIVDSRIWIRIISLLGLILFGAMLFSPKSTVQLGPDALTIRRSYHRRRIPYKQLISVRRDAIDEAGATSTLQLIQNIDGAWKVVKFHIAEDESDIFIAEVTRRIEAAN